MAPIYRNYFAGRGVCPGSRPLGHAVAPRVPRVVPPRHKVNEVPVPATPSFLIPQLPVVTQALFREAASVRLSVGRPALEEKIVRPLRPEETLISATSSPRMMAGDPPRSDPQGVLGSFTGSGRSDAAASASFPAVHVGMTLSVHGKNYVVTGVLHSDAMADSYLLWKVGAGTAFPEERDVVCLKILKPGQILVGDDVPHEMLAANAYLVKNVQIEVGGTYNFGGQDYHVEQHLGSGHTANVYLLRDRSNAPLCVKLFKQVYYEVLCSLPRLAGVPGPVGRQFLAPNAYFMEYVQGWFFADHYEDYAKEALGEPQGLRPILRHPSQRIHPAREAMRMYEGLAERGFYMKDMKANVYLITEDGRFENLDVDLNGEIASANGLSEFNDAVRGRMISCLSLVWGMKIPYKSLRDIFTEGAHLYPCAEVVPEYRAHSERARTLFKEKYASLVDFLTQSSPLSVDRVKELMKVFGGYLDELETMAREVPDKTNLIENVSRANEKLAACFEADRVISFSNLMRAFRSDHALRSSLNDMRDMIGKASYLLTHGRLEEDKKWTAFQHLGELYQSIMKALGIHHLFEEEEFAWVSSDVIRLRQATDGATARQEIFEFIEGLRDNHRLSDEAKLFWLMRVTLSGEVIPAMAPPGTEDILYPLHFSPLASSSGRWALLNPSQAQALKQLFLKPVTQPEYRPFDTFIPPTSHGKWLRTASISYVYFGVVPVSTPSELTSTVFAPDIDDPYLRLERVRRFLHDYGLIKAAIESGIEV